MTSPDGAGIPDEEGVGDWPASGTPLGNLAKMGEALVLWPFSRFLGALLDEPPEMFDTLNELFQNLIPAIIRKVLKDLANVLGGGSSEAGSSTAEDIVSKIPVIGDVVKVVQGVTTGLSGALATAAGLVGIRWEQADRTEDTAVFAKNTASAARTVAVTTVFNISTRRPLWSGLDPTAEPAFTWDGLSTATGGSTSVQSLTGSIARISKILVGQDQIRNTLSFLASKTGSPNFYVDMFKWDSEAALWRLMFSSPDLAASLSGSLTRQTIRFSLDGYPTVAGEKYAVQFRQGTTGQVQIASKTFPVAPAVGFSPGAIGGARNPTTNPAPSTISYADMESYNDGNTPWFEMGSDVGQLDLPRYYSVNFDNYSWQNWIRNTAGDGQLAVVDKAVQFTGTTAATQRATYGSPTLTNKARAYIDVLEDKFSPSYLFLNRDNSTTATGPWMAVTSQGVEIGYGNNDYVSLDTTDWRSGAGSYRFSYDPARNSGNGGYFVETWDGTDWVEIIDWNPVASGVSVPHDAAHRFGGIAITRTALTIINGSKLDNFILEDW